MRAAKIIAMKLKDKYNANGIILHAICVNIKNMALFQPILTYKPTFQTIS
jgi:hypothetical protein